MPSRINLCDHARPFLSYLQDWSQERPRVRLVDVVGDKPQTVALCSVDMVNGFCREGPLASERVGKLIPTVVSLFERAHRLGVRALLLAEDSHRADTPEFLAYPPHCIEGTNESQTVAELAALPFASDITTIKKNSLSMQIGTSFDSWLQDHPDLRTFIIVGNCTDLCVYSAAMGLRLTANAAHVPWRIIIPMDAVGTFDIPANIAREQQIKAHDGELHHLLFLHHMAMNGIEIVATLT